MLNCCGANMFCGAGMIMLLLSGCAGIRTTAVTHRGLREVVQDLNQQKLFNDLMRLRLGMPTVVVDYTTLNTQVTDASKGTAGRDKGWDGGDLKRVLSLQFETGEENQMVVDADTRIGSAYTELYKRLHEFSCKLIEAPCGPSSIPGEVKWWGTINEPKLLNGKPIVRTHTFYIPCECENEFLCLSIDALTTLQGDEEPDSKKGSGTKSREVHESLERIESNVRRNSQRSFLGR